MKKLFVGLIAALLLFCAAACTEKEGAPDPAGDTLPRVQLREISLPTDKNIGSLVNSLLSGDQEDEADVYNETTPLSETRLYVRLSDNGTTITDQEGTEGDRTAADVSGNVVVIRRGGTYELTGSLSDGQIILNCDDPVQLILRGVSVSATDTAVLKGYGRGEKTVTLSDGTENRLSDGTSDRDESEKGVIRIENGLTLNGKGKLLVDAHGENGIVAKNVRMSDGDFTVTGALDSAIEAKSSFSLANATLTLSADKDAIFCGGKTTITNSILNVAGCLCSEKTIFDRGIVTLSSATDGIVAETVLSAVDSRFRIGVKGDGLVSSGKDAVIRLVRCDTVIFDGDDGLKATYLTLSSGTLIAYGMGAQLNVSGGMECSVMPKEFLFEDALPVGKEVRVPEGRFICEKTCRFLVCYGKSTEETVLYVDETEVETVLR